MRRHLLAAGLTFGLLLGFGASVVFFPSAEAQTGAIPIPRLSVGIDAAENPEEVTLSLQILFLLTILSLAPAILIMTTSFARIVVVLSFVRQALGTQQMPPNQVLVGLALFLTFFVMGPVWSQINTKALQPYMKKEITRAEAFQHAALPLRDFMFKQTREKDLALFVGISKTPRPKNRDALPMQVLIPAFIISELKTAFQIGFLIYIPFLVIDMVIASILLSMGMMMLPPILISLPFKLMLFVLVDGWNILVGSLVRSFIPAG